MNLSASAANAMATALNTSVGTSAKLIIYSGTQPATADTAISSQTPLVTLTLSASAFGTVSANTISASGLPIQANATATGTASFARLYASDGTTAKGDFAVATSGAEVTINTTSVNSGGPVQITALSIAVTQ